MEPYQQHPVAVLLIAVLTCGQTCTVMYGQESNSACKTEVKIGSLFGKELPKNILLMVAFSSFESIKFNPQRIYYFSPSPVSLSTCPLLLNG